MKNGASVASFERVCRKCGRPKSVCAEERARKARERARVYRIANPPDPAANKVYRAANREHVAVQRREYRKRNAEKIRIKKAADYLANRDAERAKRKERRNPQVEAERAARWAKNNRDRVRANSRASAKRNAVNVKAKNARWYQANKDTARARVLSYRARKRSAPGRGITGADIRRLREEYCGLCAYCGTRQATEVDHVNALVRGGSHDPDNAAPCCKTCNSSKHDLPLVIWLARAA